MIMQMLCIELMSKLCVPCLLHARQVQEIHCNSKLQCKVSSFAFVIDMKRAFKHYLT